MIYVPVRLASAGRTAHAVLRNYVAVAVVSLWVPYSSSTGEIAYNAQAQMVCTPQNTLTTYDTAVRCLRQCTEAGDSGHRRFTLFHSQNTCAPHGPPPPPYNYCRYPVQFCLSRLWLYL